MDKRKITEYCFGIDEHTEQCGLVAIASLIKNTKDLSDLLITIYVEKNKVRCNDIIGKIKSLGFAGYQIEVREIDLSIFKCKDLFGSLACYLRILMPYYTSADRIIYIDADVIFNQDITFLADFDLCESYIGMINTAKCYEQPIVEQNLLYSSGKKPSSPYFISCLAVIDCKKYREDKIIEKTIDIIEKYGKMLVLHDQSIWNAIIQKIKKLPEDIIVNVFPKDIQMRDVSKSKIVHFIGSPKPWDILGEFLNPYYNLWYSEVKKTEIQIWPSSKYISYKSWARAKRIKSQYPEVLEILLLLFKAKKWVR